MKLDTRPVVLLFLLLAASIQLAASAHNLEEEYRFSAVLDDGYKLHWNFDLEQETISFAVNVSTIGWVGFGLSPNGQMPQSDVVIGWVNNDGTTTFHVIIGVNNMLPDYKVIFLHLGSLCYRSLSSLH